jgi:hypothetical protein
MKRSSAIILSLLIILTSSISLTGCKKKENPIKYTIGTFPDSVINLTGLNSAFDDYNSNLFLIRNKNPVPIIFSSNRNSNGGQFDIIQGTLSWQFDQTNGSFAVNGDLSNDPFIASLLMKANTPGNDFGPYSIFSSSDGYNYFFVASQTGANPLDIYYLKYLPAFGTSIPEITGPLPARIFNSTSDDAYVSIDSNADSVYFSSNRSGNFDIYLLKRPLNLTLDNWLKQDFATATAADSVNSNYEEKCPSFFKNILLFASNRPGGLGGYDLYYSVFRSSKWSSPVNMGPDINSSSDEFRPVMGYSPDFKNMYIVFSSNRPGGKGGFDLYFTGIPVINEK